jgi:hypothetical protein
LAYDDYGFVIHRYLLFVTNLARASEAKAAALKIPTRRMEAFPSN